MGKRKRLIKERKIRKEKVAMARAKYETDKKIQECFNFVIDLIVDSIIKEEQKQQAYRWN